MEKQGIIKPGVTNDTEDKLKNEKQATEQSRTEALDDDLTKRLSDGFSGNKSEQKSGS